MHIIIDTSLARHVTAEGMSPKIHKVLVHLLVHLKNIKYDEEILFVKFFLMQFKRETFIYSVFTLHSKTVYI